MIMKKYFFFSAAFILFLFLNVFADQVRMTNGDRLTGKILKKDGDVIVIKTEAAGIVKIKWEAVAEIISEEPLSVTLEDGKIVEGRIESEEEIVKINVGETEDLTIEKEKVKTVRTPEEQKRYEAEQKRLAEADLFDFWTGTLDVGFSMTSGNSDTRTFTAGAKGVRETPHNKFSVYANALQVKDTSNNSRRITAQSIWAGARYDVNIGPRYFAFGSGDFEYNKPQKLNIRAVLGGGLGYHAYRHEHFKLDLTSGVTNNYENFSNGVRRNSAELLLGEEMRVKVNSRARFTKRGVFYPNISRMGDFRALFDSSFQTDINSWLGWHVTVGNRYNSRPVDQTEKNDFQLSTGLRFSLGKKKKESSE
jgi:putative salt-induced outer membrane protein YdiY